MYIRLIISALLLANPAITILAQEVPEHVTVTANVASSKFEDALVPPVIIPDDSQYPEPPPSSDQKLSIIENRSPREFRQRPDPDPGTGSPNPNPDNNFPPILPIPIPIPPVVVPPLVPPPVPPPGPPSPPNIPPDTPEPEGPQEPDKPDKPDDDNPCAPSMSLPGILDRIQGGEAPEKCQVGQEYVIYPKNGGDSAGTSAAFAHMSALVIPSSIYTSEIPDHGVLFWRAVLTGAQAEKLSGDPNIAVVYQPCKESCFDPGVEIAMQKNAPDDLVVAGQFPRQGLDWYRSNYVFNEIAGKDTDVYILDSGAFLEHDEFTGGTNIASRARWLHTNPEIEASENDGGSGHGTCMLARMGGHDFGIAKKVNPVIVRVPKSKTNVEYYLEGLKAIAADPLRQKSSVLSMSLYWPRFQDSGEPIFKNSDGTDAYDSIRRTMGSLLKTLVEKGVLLVAGSGNNGRASIDGIPADFADPKAADYIPDLIVVGGTNPTGTKMYINTNRDAGKNLPHIYAPGEDIKCPSIVLHNDYRPTKGTSPSTAAVAGLAAYFLSL